MLQVLAAGSLRQVWPGLMARFKRATGIVTQTHFGPAGLLRKRIEQGETCDLFASANIAHPQALQRAGYASDVSTFAGNRLCLTVAKEKFNDGCDWLTLLTRSDLRLATSTPGSDPSGDYAWQLFDRIEKNHPGYGLQLKARAQMLVGSSENTIIPEGEIAAAWIIRNSYADMFIGYRSYATWLRQQSDLRVLDIPDRYNICSVYASALCQARARPLSDFLQLSETQAYLIEAGFES